jgi:hypothetical protein
MANPESCLNDYHVVREAMRQSSTGHPLELSEVARLIGEYASLLERLAAGERADGLPHDLMVRTRVFLRDLQALGETMRYDHRMRESHPYNHSGRAWPPSLRGKGC